MAVSTYQIAAKWVFGKRIFIDTQQVDQMKSAQSDVQLQDKCPVGNQGLNHVYSKNPQVFTWTVITVGGGA